MRLLVSRRLALMRRYQGGMSFGPEPTAADLAAAFGLSRTGPRGTPPTLTTRRNCPRPVSVSTHGTRASIESRASAARMSRGQYSLGGASGAPDTDGPGDRGA